MEMATPEPLFAEVIDDKLLHLAASFADQGDDVNVGAGGARQHAQQGALAHAGPGEDADALPLPQRQERVDGPDAGGQRRIDHAAFERRGGLLMHRLLFG